MQPARIAELLGPFLEDQNSQLTDGILARISAYIDLLLHWNARINLTAIRDPEEIVTRHFGESLFAARHLYQTSWTDAAFSKTGRGKVTSSIERIDADVDHRERAALRDLIDASQGLKASAPEIDQHPLANGYTFPTLADVGSGAGFPGLPIGLWVLGVHVTLIESNHKKMAFLREAVRALTLSNIDIKSVRAETLPPSSFATVTLRAVDRFESILPIAAGLVVPGGRIALLIASSQLAIAQATLPDMAWLAPLHIPCSQARILAVAYRR